MSMKKACFKKNSSPENEDEKNSIVKNIVLDDADEKTSIYYKNILT